MFLFFWEEFKKNVQTPQHRMATVQQGIEPRTFLDLKYATCWNLSQYHRAKAGHTLDKLDINYER